MSRQQILDHFAIDVSQPEITPCVSVCQPHVIQAQQMQHCGMQIVHMNAIFHGIVTVLVRVAVGQSALNTAAR